MAGTKMKKNYADRSDVTFPHPFEPYPNLIINVALTGVIPTRRMTPHVPIQPDEVIEDAARCIDAGATIVHVHARDAEGQPTYRRSVFARIISGIRKARRDAIICATTSGRRYGDFRQRAAVLDLDGESKPDMGSLTMGSLNFPDGPSVNHPDIVERLAVRMRERGIKPEIEALELGMVNSANVLIKKGVLAPPYYFNILLGSAHTAPATMLNLSAFIAGLPRNAVWSACGLGRFQFPINVAAIAMGGHVRVGIEDNLYYNNERTRLATNVEMVERAARVAAELGRAIATPAEARAMIGLPKAR
ncbi:MAG: 3-keto-5-aminohexanoate cleavage protein [Planctomycetota bacterium]